MSASLRIALLMVALAPASVAVAPAGATSHGASACAHHAPEAARRSGLSVEIILGVMYAESRGRPRAISPKGAIGCMQIMPPTWAHLTRRYSLGRDPWDARMNMIGGALYLAELVRQFGMPGAYSAYNAGPGRYRRHVRDGVPLPAETVAYAAALTGKAPPRAPSYAQADRDPTIRWQEAGLFMTAPRTQAAQPSRSVDTDGAQPQSSHGLFPLTASAQSTEPA
jgi:soluble lytic murein transglycosylase-like protein